LTTITKDASEHVTRWNNKLGVVGSDLSIYGGTPQWTTDGILFDGVGDFIKSAAFTWNQPNFIYSVLTMLTITANDRLMSGLGTTSGALLVSGTEGGVKASAGTASALTMLGTSKAIIRELYNGANSKLIVNNDTPTTGNFGAQVRGAFTIGARGLVGTTADNYANILSCHHICRKTADAASLETKIYDLLAKLNGFIKI